MSARIRLLRYGIVYGSAILLACFSLIPLLWGISTSFKSNSTVYAQPPQWIPTSPTFDNYASILGDSDMLRYFQNTVIIASGATMLSLVVGILAAFGFSRYRFFGKQSMLVAILFTTLLPGIAIMIPLYVTLSNLSLLNTYGGLILVYLVVVLPIAVWLLKGFFDKIPHEIYEAAVIDGCSVLRMLWRILIPITLPSIAAVGLYAFVMAWNEFWFALIFTFGKETRTQSVALGFFINEQGIQWGQLMAGTVLVSLPAIAIFALVQQAFVNSLGEGAVKG